ncbi:MAG: hypothetical protein WD379_09390 [Dehalococcoidia bacterium]
MERNILERLKLATVRIVTGAFIAGAAAAALAGGLPGRDGSASDAQTPTVFAIDVDPSGNSQTSLGDIDECATVEQGAFDIDIVVANVDGLLAWESLLAFDEEILTVTAIDVRQFLSAGSGSSVVNVSASVPNGSGSFYMGAGDISAGTESGDGVLARLTLEATDSGVSPLALAYRDVDGDGVVDLGPTLSGLTIADQAIHIGDADGDELFDSPTNARIAVDMPCPAPTPTPAPTPAPGGGSGGGSDDPLTPEEVEESIRDGEQALQDVDSILNGTTGSDEAVFVPGQGSGDDNDGPGASSGDGQNGGDGPGIEVGGSSGGGDDWPDWLIGLIVGAPIAFSVGLLALWRSRRPGL